MDVQLTKTACFSFPRAQPAAESCSVKSLLWAGMCSEGSHWRTIELVKPLEDVSTAHWPVLGRHVAMSARPSQSKSVFWMGMSPGTPHWLTIELAEVRTAH
jgi:hypothetical protein